MSSTSQLIFVNSADRTSGTAEDFYVNLVDINNDFEDTSLAIQELCIPFSNYPINSNNNTIALSGISGSWNANLTPSNYTPTTFITEFVNQFGSTGSLGIAGGITGSYNTATSRFSFGTIAGTDFSITPTIYNGKYLGLSAGTHNSVNHVITSDRNVILSGALQVRILTDLSIYSTNTRDNNRNVLCSVYPDCQYGDIITKNLSNFTHIKMSSPFIGLTRFYLVDELYQPIDLNGLDWSITLIRTDYNRN